MAFKTRWQCMQCGNIIWASSEPDETECPCYVEVMDDDMPKQIEMAKEERNNRYREQYRLNGYCWKDGKQEMFYGKFKMYQDRTYLKK